MDVDGNEGDRLRQQHSSSLHAHSAGESSCYSSQDMSLGGQSSLSVLPTSAASQSTFGSSKCSNLQKTATASQDSSFLLDADSGIISKTNSSASTLSAFTVSSLSQSYSASDLSQGNSVVGKSSTSSATATTTANAADTAENAGSSTTCIIRTSSQTVTQMPTKRKIDDFEANSMQKRTKLSVASPPEDHPIGKCVVCVTERSNAAFVHGRVLHVCCCYKCAVKVWNKSKRCPLCNLPLKTVKKVFFN